MIYKNPGFAYSSDPHSDGISVGSGAGDLLRFLRSLPDSFEIVPEGHVCVKWPEGLTQSRIKYLLSHPFARDAYLLHALAAIAPVEKTRRVALWEVCTQAELVVKPIDWQPDKPTGWKRRGECEVTA